MYAGEYLQLKLFTTHVLADRTSNSLLLIATAPEETVRNSPEDIHIGVPAVALQFPNVAIALSNAVDVDTGEGETTSYAPRNGSRNQSTVVQDKYVSSSKIM